MKICESFNAWLETKSINENIASAKIFMQKMYARELDKSQSTLTKEEQDRALENPDYLRINKLYWIIVYFISHYKIDPITIQNQGWPQFLMNISILYLVQFEQCETKHPDESIHQHL